MGADLFVQADDLQKYLDAIVAFWKFVLERIR
jgi:hypothetical protein